MISIIIINYKTTEILRNCIESLYALEDKNNFEVIIVDNASKDGSEDRLSQLCDNHDNIRCIHLDETTSFSNANNTGAEGAKGDYLLIMNPDIIFTEPVINALSDFLKNNPDTAAVSPLLFGEDGRFQSNYYQRYPTISQYIFFHSVVSFFFRDSDYLSERFLINTPPEKIIGAKILNVEQIPFAFFLISRDLFVKAGKMDELFEIYFEDVDFCYRLNKEFKLAVIGDAAVKHIGGVSFNKEDNWWVYGKYMMSMLYFFRKNYGRTRYSVLRMLLVLNSGIALAAEKLRSAFSKGKNFRQTKHSYFFEELKKQSWKFDISSNSKLQR